MRNKILVTGGAGYIGSHTCIALHEAGYDFIVYDNLSNSSYEAISRVSTLIGKPIEFIKGDIRDAKSLKRVFAAHHFFGVIHFAGLKAVGESVAKPLMYYNNNVSGSITLLEVMSEYDVKTLSFHPLQLSMVTPRRYLSMSSQNVLVPIHMGRVSWQLSIY